MTVPGTVPEAVRREFQRKAIHAATAVFPVALAAGAPVGLVRWGATAAFGIAVVVELLRRVSPAARTTFEGLVGGMLRTHEAAGGLAGATWMFGAYAAAVWWAPAQVAVVAMWAVAAGDAAGALVGRLVGRVRYPWGKSLEGSLTLAAMTAAGAWGLAGYAVGPAALLGALAAIAEAPARPFDDNVRIVTVLCVTGKLLVF